MNIFDILKTAKNMDASDIHITVGSPIIAKVKGKFINLTEKTLDKFDTEKILEEISDEKSLKTVIENGECDFAITLETNERFRVSTYKQMGNYAIAIRVIKSEIPTFESLHLPEIIKKFTKINRGLVLITGPTGSGKTTTLASIIDIINSNYQKHIITLEDPIEYIHHHKKSIVNQREIGKDSKSFNSALKSILRQDPDVILIGEMRDEESIASAISASETGHLVFSTVHTIGAAKTIDRIVDMFPANKQNQIRMQLSCVCEGIISQQLVPTVDGNLTVALEIMIITPAIRNLIRENKIYQIQNIINTNAKLGMISMDQSLLNLYQNGIISKECLLDRCVDYEYIIKLIGDLI